LIEVEISGIGTLKNEVLFEDGQDSIMWESHCSLLTRYMKSAISIEWEYVTDF
jgi:hypothetical protein